MAVTYNADASWLKIYKNGKAVYQAANSADFGSVTNTAYLYIGNDQRNDVWPAAEAGMKTALFAADTRSLRLREDPPDASAVVPALIITDLAQIPGCIAD